MPATSPRPPAPAPPDCLRPRGALSHREAVPVYSVSPFMQLRGGSVSPRLGRRNQDHRGAATRSDSSLRMCYAITGKRGWWSWWR
ncbi:hypothetical protein VTG60DRAFT_2293 [Thermothelomyces hinnuleus]